MLRTQTFFLIRESPPPAHLVYQIRGGGRSLCRAVWRKTGWNACPGRSLVCCFFVVPGWAQC